MEFERNDSTLKLCKVPVSLKLNNHTNHPLTPIDIPIYTATTITFQSVISEGLTFVIHIISVTVISTAIKAVKTLTLKYAFHVYHPNNKYQEIYIVVVNNSLIAL